MSVRNDTKQHGSRLVATLATVLAISVCLMVPGEVAAADRMVLVENFGGTWCQYCPGADGAISRILDDGDLNWVPICWHIDDLYEIPTGQQRDDQYGITGYPTTWFDAILSYVGGSTDPMNNALYNAYRNRIITRMADSTPVMIDLACENVAGLTFKATATISLERDNPSENAEVWFCAVQDHYPTTEWYFRFTARRAPETPVEVRISETAPVVVEWSFNVGAAWDQEECYVVAWVEQADAAGIGDVRQAAYTPLLAPQTVGDLDGDGDVDLTDFAFFAQCFGGSDNPPGAGCAPGVDADFDGDGDVDLSDFSILGENFTGSL